MENRSLTPGLYDISPDCSKAEFLAVCKVYAREIVNEYDLNVNVSNLSWRVSMRAKRRAGSVHHRNGKPESIKLTWEYFEKEGWSAIAGTVRHELIHVHLLNEEIETDGHGEAFKRYAERLDTHIYCKRFAEPKWWVVCNDCEGRTARYRRSKLVKKPEQYECSKCGGRLLVKQNKK